MKRKCIVILIVLMLLTGCNKQPVSKKISFELRDGVIFSFLEKENTSNKEIVFSFLITNDSGLVYSKNNKIHVRIGEYAGIIQIDNDVSDMGQGEIIINGSIKEKMFRDLYESDLEDIDYKIEEYFE